MSGGGLSPSSLAKQTLGHLVSLTAMPVGWSLANVVLEKAMQNLLKNGLLRHTEIVKLLPE